MGRPAALLAAALLLCEHETLAVDHAKFRTCSQTGFCRRHRSVDPPRGYVIAPESIVASDGGLQMKLHGGPFGAPLTLSLHAYDSGVARLRVVETTPLHGPRWEPNDILEPLTSAPLTEVTAADVEAGSALQSLLSSSAAVAYAFAVGNGAATIVLHKHPFRAELWQEGEKVVSLNPAGKLYFEHHRKRGETAVALR